MLPLIQEQVVGNGWLSATELVDFLAVSESTPGPFAINVSTYIGMVMGGVGGAVCATLGVVLPSFLIILLIARYYLKFKEHFLVVNAMQGLRPAVVALIASAVISVGTTVFLPYGWSTAAVITPAFAASVVVLLLALVAQQKKVHPIIIIVACGVLGIAAGMGGII